MTADYRVELSRRARKQYDALDGPVRRRLAPAIARLADDPRPAGAIPLTGTTGLMRVRVGDWRVIYQVQDAVLLVLVVQVGHRREVYRDA